MQTLHSKSGLTLIEVLIAALLLTVGLTTMLAASARCLKVMKKSSLYQRTQWCHNLGELEHPMLPVEDHEEWNVSGEVYDDDLLYEREVEPRSLDEEDGLFVVTSRVSWSEKGRDNREEIVRYRYLPELVEE